MPPKFGKVAAPWWDDGRPTFVIGGGPSLRGRDLSGLRARGWVIAVNRAAEFWACDAVFTLDVKFAKERAADLREWAAAGAEVFVCLPDGVAGLRAIPGVVCLERVHVRGLSFDLGKIANGLNSGYGAINLAVLKRAREIVLLGFDLDPSPAAAGRHWHDGYPWDQAKASPNYSRWAERFGDIAKHLPEGVRVVNANPNSTIRAFPFASYEEYGLL